MVQLRLSFRLRKIFLQFWKYIFKRPSITEWILLFIVLVLIALKFNPIEYFTKSELERKTIYTTDELDMKVIEGPRPRAE